MQMECSNCYRRKDDGDKICSYCGHNLSEFIKPEKRNINYQNMRFSFFLINVLFGVPGIIVIGVLLDLYNDHIFSKDGFLILFWIHFIWLLFNLYFFSKPSDDFFKIKYFIKGYIITCVSSIAFFVLLITFSIGI
jgi:hypothetical protein